MKRLQIWQQRGATLFVALIMLLLLTLLALSGMRATMLESRLTANTLLQQKLSNAAESGLRDGETSLLSHAVQEPTETCGQLAEPCVLRAKLINSFYFDHPGMFREYAPEDGEYAPQNVDIDWYSIPVPAGANAASSVNPGFGDAPGFAGGGSSGSGSSVLYYEVNSRAKLYSKPSSIYLRSTVVRVVDW